MTKNKKRYHVLRFVTIVLTTFQLPLGTFVGYQFGAGHTRFAIIALLFQCGFTFIQSYVWWLTLESESSK